MAATTLPAAAQHGGTSTPDIDQLPATQISGPLEFHQQPFDVLHYDATIDLTAAPLKQIAGSCAMRIYWAGEPDGAFYFHLRDLTVDSVFYNGVPATALPVGTITDPDFHYLVVPPATVKRGDTDVVRVVYSGEMTDEYGPGYWGGVSSSATGPLFAMGVGFYNNYVSSTQHWLPCYDHPSDKATFHGRFRVKKGKLVASNGLLQVLPDTDSTEIYDWTHNIACATYLLTFAVDSYVPVTIAEGPLPMVVYARPSDSAATHRSFKLLPRMVSAYERHFGAFPFEKVGYVNTTIGAMEHQTMVSFPTSLSRSGDTVNSTGAHELSHQWFGDLVSPLDFRHAWLNESFATFCESVWMEELKGFPGYIADQESKRSRYIKTVSRQEGIFPLYDFPRAQPSSNYPETIYQKGAVVVGMLRYELGDSIFFTGMREYLRRFGYGVATTDSLRTVLEQAAGRSLGWFFDQWVIGKGWPVVTLRAVTLPEGSGTGHRVEIELNQTQTNTGTIFTGLPVEIGFKGPAGTTYRVVRMNGATEKVTLDSIPEFTSITINQGPSLRALMEGSVLSFSGVERGDGFAAADGVRVVVRPNMLKDDGAFSAEVRGSDNCTGIAYEIYDTSGRRVSTGHSDACQFTVPATQLGSGAHMIRFILREVPYDVPVMIAR